MRKTTDCQKYRDKGKINGSKSRFQSQVQTKIQKKTSFQEYEEELRVTPCFNYSNVSKDKNEGETLRQPKLEDFELGESKGQGRFGKVYAAIHKKTGLVVALKKIKK